MSFVLGFILGSVLSRGTGGKKRRGGYSKRAQSLGYKNRNPPPTPQPRRSKQ